MIREIWADAAKSLDKNGDYQPEFFSRVFSAR